MDPVLFYKNLAESTRLKILLLTLEEQELCVCEYVQALDLSQPKISRHLAQLRQFDLLTDRKEGKWVYYSISDNLQEWQIQTIKTCASNNKAYLTEELMRLSAFGERPKRQSNCC